MKNKVKREQKTKWDLSLLYDSAKDPRIEKDLFRIEAAFGAFQRKYKPARRSSGVYSPSYLKDETSLLKALKDYELLFEVLPISSAINYFSYRKDLDGKDSEAESQINIISERLAKASNRLIFFELSLGKLDHKMQGRFLKSKKLERFHYFLRVIFDKSKYNLSEPEEKILNLKSQTSRDLWISANQKMLSGQSIEYKGKMIPIGVALDTIHTIDDQDKRAKFHRVVFEKLRDKSDLAEAEINAIILNKKVDDELRGYEKPYLSTVLSYQNDPQTVQNLVEAVTKHFYVSHRFMKLKAKMLGLKKLGYQDRNVSVGKINANFNLSTTVDIIRRSLGRIQYSTGSQTSSNIYLDIFNRFISKGQIDVYPKMGKTSGAYCSSNMNAPTFVLLNHMNDFKSVTTFAHEMGHAIHTELSRAKQPPLYRDYTISTAEVASTFFENFAFDEVFYLLSEKDRAVALHDKISRDISTVFRQIACFGFELELHNEIRKKGSMTKEDMAIMLNKHMSSYLGPVVDMKDIDGYFFVTWNHIRNFFYVYSYAFGQLISRVLYKKLQESKDNSFAIKIDQFLSAGGSKSPENIFKNIGIDVSDRLFFTDGLKAIDADIDRLEGLT